MVSNYTRRSLDGKARHSIQEAKIMCIRRKKAIIPEPQPKPIQLRLNMYKAFKARTLRRTNGHLD